MESVFAPLRGWYDYENRKMFRVWVFAPLRGLYH